MEQLPSLHVICHCTAPYFVVSCGYEFLCNDVSIVSVD